MEEIKAKAMRKDFESSKVAEVNLTHMNPLKYPQTAKYQLENKHKDTLDKLHDLETIMSKHITLLDYDPVHVDEIDFSLLFKIPNTDISTIKTVTGGDPKEKKSLLSNQSSS